MSAAKVTLLSNPSPLWDCMQSIESIETSLTDSSLTQEVTALLFTRLREASNSVGDLAKNNFDVAELENKIVDLYGRISHLSVDLELANLKKEGEKLEAMLSSSSGHKEISIQISFLKNRIVSLCYECALSQTEKEVIREINTTIQKANNLLYGQAPTKKKSFFLSYDEAVDIDLISPFFDIAYLIYKGKYKEAKLQYLQNLSQQDRKEVQGHFHSITKGNILDFQEHPLAIIQALLASAYQLSQTEYEIADLSPQEIQLMFEELDEILSKKD